MTRTAVSFSVNCEEIHDGALCKMLLDEDGQKVNCDLTITAAKGTSIKATLNCSGDKQVFQKVFSR